MIEIPETLTKNEPKAAENNESDKRHSPLKPAQRRAVEMLAKGGRIVDAARIAGVHRNTLGRWLNDPRFIDELKRYEGQLREAARARMFALTDRAATCIEYTIAKGDARLALQLLKTLDVHRLEPVGATHMSRGQLEWLDEIGAGESNAAAHDDSEWEDRSDCEFRDDDSDVTRDDGSKGNRDAAGGTGLFGFPLANDDRPHDGNGNGRGGAGMPADKYDRHQTPQQESQAVAPAESPLVDSPVVDAQSGDAQSGETDAADLQLDDPNRYFSPVHGNLAPEPDGSSSSSGSKSSSNTEGPSEKAASEETANCVSTRFKTHYYALFCTIAAFIARFSPVKIVLDTHRRPRTSGTPLRQRGLFQTLNVSSFHSQPGYAGTASPGLLGTGLLSAAFLPRWLQRALFSGHLLGWRGLYARRARATICTSS